MGMNCGSFSSSRLSSCRRVQLAGELAEEPVVSPGVAHVGHGRRMNTSGFAFEM